MTYSRALWLPEVLKASGVEVNVHTGFATAGRPPATGNFDPRAVLVHHDASAKGYTPTEPSYILKGRPPGTPGPLSQLWVDLHGVWHCLASGRCNHAGVGSGWGVIPKDSGNTYAIGVETDHTTGEAVPADFRASLVAGLAGILGYLHADVDKACAGHKEYAPGRKTDPDWSMPDLRSAIKVSHGTLLSANVINPDHGPWGPFPWEPTHAAGPNPRSLVTWHDGTKSRFDAACVRAIQREVHAPVTGVYDRATTERVATYRETYGLGNGGGTDKRTWDFMVRR